MYDSSSSDECGGNMEECRRRSSYLYIIGRCANDGFGRIQSNEIAHELWHRGASIPNNDGSCEYAIGYNYNQGTGVTKDSKVIVSMSFVTLLGCPYERVMV
jgi:hypothetical protein